MIFEVSLIWKIIHTPGFNPEETETLKNILYRKAWNTETSGESLGHETP